MTRTPPLDSLRVLDLSRILTGPFCTMVLGDFGAEVWKVERPGTGDDTRSYGPPFVGGESAYFLSVNRNKKSLALDLRTGGGQDVMRRLVAWADVLVENFRPGTMESLGFGPEPCLALNGRLIYTRITGFGSKGPDATRPGFDLVAQGLSGLMALTGEVDGPPAKAAFSIGDIGAGMWAVTGILMALRERDRTGRGGVVETSLLGSLLSWQTYLGQSAFVTGRSPGRQGSAHTSIVPYQRFQAKDGYFTLAAGSQKSWRSLARLVGRADLADDVRFATNAARVENREALLEVLEPLFLGRTVAEWVADFRREGIPAGEILDVAEAQVHPQAAALDLIRAYDHPAAGRMQTVLAPLTLDGERPVKVSPPPALGQHTREILEAVGYTPSEIAALREGGAIS